MSKASKKQAIKQIDKYIYGQLTSPEAKKSRLLIALMAKNPVMKVKWDEPKK